MCVCVFYETLHNNLGTSLKQRLGVLSKRTDWAPLIQSATDAEAGEYPS